MKIVGRLIITISTVSTLGLAFSTKTTILSKSSSSTISSSSSSSSSSSTNSCLLAVPNDDDINTINASQRRRDIIATSILGWMGLVGSSTSIARAEDDNETSKSTDGEGVVMYKTSSGLKYIELEPGRASESSPRYGQLCVISYKAYLKLPNSKEKEQFDSSGSYVLKHGSGRMIAGLDEGLHTMKPGGLRRIIIPPKLGFVQIGLGPLPIYPWDRRKLNSLLDQMIAQQGGNLVYDVRLEKVMDDEADQGYYEDLELTPEELEEIQNKLLKGRESS